MQGSVRVVKLSIQSAEVEFVVPVENAVGMQLKGFVAGPQCEGRTTVEIPYTIYPRETDSTGEVVGRALIPEPCIWSEEAPFEYLARLELWKDEKVVEKDGFKFQL